MGTVKYRLSAGRDELRTEVERLAASPGLAQSTVVGLGTWLDSIRRAAS